MRKGGRCLRWAARHVEDGAPVAPHAGVSAAANVPPDLSIEVVPLRRLHRDVAGEGVQERDVLLGCVVLLPDVASNLDVFEQATGFNLGRLIRDLLWGRRRPLARIALPNCVIDLLDLGEEGIEASGERVPGAPERQVAAGPQEPVRLAVADRGIDPVPSRCGVDELKRFRLALPSLERRDVNLNWKAS